jgi:hypothetical protein
MIGTGDFKEYMPDPTGIRSNNFKDDCRILDASSCKLALLIYWIVVSLPMVTTYAP